MTQRIADRQDHLHLAGVDDVVGAHDVGEQQEQAADQVGTARADDAAGLVEALQRDLRVEQLGPAGHRAPERVFEDLLGLGAELHAL